jgi:hypothetical protein
MKLIINGGLKMIRCHFLKDGVTTEILIMDKAAAEQKANREKLQVIFGNPTKRSFPDFYYTHQFSMDR